MSRDCWHAVDAQGQQGRFPLVVQQYPPQRQPLLADPGPGLDLGADARRAIAERISSVTTRTSAGKECSASMVATASGMAAPPPER